VSQNMVPTCKRVPTLHFWLNFLCPNEHLLVSRESIGHLRGSVGSSALKRGKFCLLLLMIDQIVSLRAVETSAFIIVRLYLLRTNIWLSIAPVLRRLTLASLNLRNSKQQQSWRVIVLTKMHKCKLRM